MTHPLLIPIFRLAVPHTGRLLTWNQEGDAKADKDSKKMASRMA
jgi:hypothetical protein